MLELHFSIRSIINEIMYFLAFFIIIQKLGYKPSYNKIISISIIMFLIVFITKGQLYFNHISINQYIDHLIVTIIICKVIYKIDYRNTFVYSIIYSSLYMIIRTTLHYCILFIDVIISESLNISADFDILEIIVAGLLIIILVFMFNKIRKLYKNKKYYVYIVLTIVVNALVILFLNQATYRIYDMYDIVTDNNISYDFSLNFMPFVNFVDVALPYIIVMVNIILITVFIDSIKSTKENAKLELMNEKLDMQHNYYLTVKESQDKIRELYHDINNHMNNIKTMKNNTEEVNEYIDSINDEIKYIKNVYSTENLLLDTILNEKRKICDKNNIELTCDINFSKCDFIQMIDTTSIFSNLLDNTIEACMKIDSENIKRYINIRGTFVKGYYVIRCENSKINDIKMKNNKIISSKKDKNNHGIGIQSIKSSIKKYDGELQIKIEKEKFTGIIYIPI